MRTWISCLLVIMLNGVGFGFDYEEYGKRNYGLVFNREFNDIKQEILENPTIINFWTHFYGNRTDSSLGLLLQPPLTKVFIDFHNSHQWADIEESGKLPQYKDINNRFKNRTADVFKKNDIEIVDEYKLDIPTLYMKTNYLDLHNFAYIKGMRHFMISIELKRSLIDPVTGLQISHTVWKRSIKTETMEDDLSGIELFSKDFIKREIDNLIEYEFKRGLFKAIIRQLKEEDKLPEAYKPILANYKDW